MPAFGALQDFLVRLPVFINGTALEMVTSVEVTLDSGRTAIFTTTAGFAGFAEGAKMVTLKVSGPVPVSGPEASAWNLANSGDWVSIQVGCGRVDFMGNGKIIDANISGSVNQAVENSFTWQGTPANLE
ncbi:MAG: hypothetical protein PHS14_19020 [Elusimicrobia bacterium]|nr:hypothetical protein [Elusimicrobiota bacterium]